LSVYFIRYKVNPQILRTVYFSYIHPHLLYAVEVYANTKKSFLKGLMTINNKILRILQQQPLHTHTVELYKMYNTLTIPDRHYYQLCNLVHKFLYRLIKRNCLQHIAITLHKIIANRSRVSCINTNNNTGELKMREWKMQEWKYRHEAV